MSAEVSSQPHFVQSIQHLDMCFCSNQLEVEHDNQLLAAEETS